MRRLSLVLVLAVLGLLIPASAFAIDHITITTKPVTVLVPVVKKTYLAHSLSDLDKKKPKHKKKKKKKKPKPPTGRPVEVDVDVSSNEDGTDNFGIDVQQNASATKYRPVVTWDSVAALKAAAAGPVSQENEFLNVPNLPGTTVVANPDGSVKIDMAANLGHWGTYSALFKPSGPGTAVGPPVNCTGGTFMQYTGSLTGPLNYVTGSKLGTIKVMTFQATLVENTGGPVTCAAAPPPSTCTSSTLAFGSDQSSQWTLVGQSTGGQTFAYGSRSVPEDQAGGGPGTLGQTWIWTGLPAADFTVGAGLMSAELKLTPDLPFGPNADFKLTPSTPLTTFPCGAATASEVLGTWSGTGTVNSLWTGTSLPMFDGAQGFQGFLEEIP